MRQLQAWPLLLLLLAGNTPADSPQQAPKPAAGETVTLIISVRDNHGNLVDGIGAEEFRILEDGVEQKISSFSADGYPLSTVIVLDRGMSSKLANEVQKSAGAIAGNLTEFDEAAIGLFESFYEPVAGFTSNNDHIQEKLKEVKLNIFGATQGSAPMTTGPRINGQSVGTGVPGGNMSLSRGPKNLDDAINSAAQLLSGREKSRRKIILVVTDGRNSHSAQPGFDTVIRRLQTDGIAVFGIVAGGFPGGSTQLRRYANATGGDVRYASSREEFEAAYGRLAEAARNPYTISYAPQGTDRKKDFHDLDIRVKRTGLTIAAPQAYFVPKEAEKQ
ncbi:MAG: VWA domain-containing protein [Acidobacteria bacterium]|nr:VWA domain-containing protein [Acidobacteriota bacterium]